MPVYNVKKNKYRIPIRAGLNGIFKLKTKELQKYSSLQMNTEQRKSILNQNTNK